MLPYAQGVEEAIFYVQEAMKNEAAATDIGDNLDPALEQDVLDCQDYEEETHPDFAHLDPDQIVKETNVQLKNNTFRKI